MFVTFFDSCMVGLAAMMVWRISPFIVFPLWLTFASMDGAFLSSALTKVPSGAWFTITLAAALASILLLWRYGKEQQWVAEAEDRYPTAHFVTTNSDNQVCLSARFESTPLSTIRGFGVYFDKAGETTPIVFSQFVLKLTSLPEVTVFFHLRPLEVPSVSPEDRYTVSRLGIPNCYRLVTRFGYNDEVVTPDLASVIANQLRQYLLNDMSHAAHPAPHSSPDDKEVGETHNDTSMLETSNVSDSVPEKSSVAGWPSVEEQLAKLESAYSHNVLYIIGKEQMKIKSKTNPFRLSLLWLFLWLRDNTRNKMANLRVPTDKVVEVGFLKEI